MRLSFAVLAAVLCLTPPLAQAQVNHEAGHPSYRNWVNQKATSCCNNDDCGEIADADVREQGDETQVRIEGQWCSVEPWMRLKTGNAPNWATNHACVIKDSIALADRRPCARLICFQPKPGI